MDIGNIAAGFGAGLTVLGAGMGISKLAAAALESMGRQPEAAGDLRTSMIIAAALIEGVAFFSLVICMLLATAS
ncbi:MAG: ATP synthase F0 subunit C [Candidatus Eisenbacteria bacterium]